MITLTAPHQLLKPPTLKMNAYPSLVAPIILIVHLATVFLLAIHNLKIDMKIMQLFSKHTNFVHFIDFL